MGRSERRAGLLAGALLLAGVLLAFAHDFARRGGIAPRQVSRPEIPRSAVPAELWREEPPVPLRTRDLQGVAVDEAGAIAVIAGAELLRLDGAGKLAARVALPGPAFGLAFAQGRCYLALRDRIAVLDGSGALLATWEGLGERAWLTSIAERGGEVLAADAGNRLVWRFDADGRLAGVFGRRDRGSGEEGFIVPSPYFDLAFAPDGALWVANPGLHRVERRSAEGRLLAQWGTTSLGPEGFSGCCNPSHLAILPDGSFLTSEKGTPRVKRSDAAGRLLGIVAGAEAFAAHAIDLDLAVAPGGRVLVLDPSRSALRAFVRVAAGAGEGRGGS